MATRKRKSKNTQDSAAARDPRNASLRVSSELRNALKAASAIQGEPLYDLTNQIVGDYLEASGFQSLVQQARRKLPAFQAS